jgi:hypothetical protein
VNEARVLSDRGVPEGPENQVDAHLIARSLRFEPLEHVLVDAQRDNQLSTFMEYVNSNIVREMTRLLDWPHRIWARRYQAILGGQDLGRAARDVGGEVGHRVRPILAVGVATRTWRGVCAAESHYQAYPDEEIFGRGC